MKVSADPRHQKRIHLMQDIFAWDFYHRSLPKTPEGKEIVEHVPEIDEWIKQAAPTWPLTQINKVDLAIMRLAVYELLVKKEVPYRVVIDEAVELAKQFGSEASASFINGALGNLVTLQTLDKQEKMGKKGAV